MLSGMRWVKVPQPPCCICGDKMHYGVHIRVCSILGVTDESHNCCEAMARWVFKIYKN